jgi:hypothetical protein
MPANAIVGPVALYNNFPINPQFFQPWTLVITNIALGPTTTVTLMPSDTFPSINAFNYSVGQQVRLVIPPTFGCRQLNGQSGYILSIPSSTQVILDINSAQNVNAFVASSATTQPQMTAIGDINSGPINANGRQNTSTVIPGSFINIGPN